MGKSSTILGNLRNKITKINKNSQKQKTDENLQDNEDEALDLGHFDEDLEGKLDEMELKNTNKENDDDVVLLDDEDDIDEDLLLDDEDEIDEGDDKSREDSDNVQEDDIDEDLLLDDEDLEDLDDEDLEDLDDENNDGSKDESSDKEGNFAIPKDSQRNTPHNYNSGKEINVEDIIREEVDNKVFSWLDKNLSPMVEKIIRDELKKIIK